MLAAIELAVQRCDREAFSLPPCPYETLSVESCQPTLEFSWRHVKGQLPAWQELQFLHA